MEFLSNFQRTPRASECIVHNGVSKQTNKWKSVHSYSLQSNSPPPQHLSRGYLSRRERGRIAIILPHPIKNNNSVLPASFLTLCIQRTYSDVKNSEARSVSSIVFLYCSPFHWHINYSPVFSSV